MKPFIKLKNIIVYHLGKFLLRGPANQLILIISLLGLISITGGIIIFKSGSGQKTVMESVWWAFLRLTDPGYLGSDLGTFKRIISTKVTMFGYVIFLGSLVAIMTQWLNSSLLKLEAGLTPIYRKGHILILGWNNKSSIIIKELILSQERVRKFLRRHEKSKLHIVVLTNKVNTAIMNGFKNEMGKLYKQSMISFRAGNHLLLEDLQKVDFLNAGVIIIPGGSYSSINESIDSKTIKTIMTIKDYANITESPEPSIVAEIFDEGKSTLLENLYRGKIELVTSNNLIGKLFALNIRHKNLSQVFSEILTNDKNEIYLRKEESYTGRTINEIRFSYEFSIVLGLLRSNEEVLLAPSGETIIDKDDQIILLAKNYSHTGIKKDSPEIFSYNVKNTKKIKKPLSKKILIIGWSRKIPFLLRELNGTKNESYTIELFSTIPRAERVSLLNRFNVSTRVKHNYGNPTILSDMEKIPFENYDSILIAASEWTLSDEDADARTLMTYLIVQKIILEKKTDPQITIELLDPDNNILFNDENSETIISPTIISYNLSQVAVRPELNSIYEILLRSQGAEIYTENFDNFLKNINEMTFMEISKNALKRGEIAIGILIQKNSKTEMIINPPINSNWKISKKDRIILLKGDY